MNEKVLSGLIIGVFVLIVGVAIFLQKYFGRKMLVIRKLKKAAGMSMSSVLSGEISKVVGRVETVGEPLAAPLSGRKCAYYYVLVEKLESAGKSNYWKKIIEEEQITTFVIRDGRNRACVNTQNIKSYVVQDIEYKSGFRNDATPTMEAFLAKYGEKSENFLGMNKSLRYKEGVLEESEVIAAMGRAEWKSASELNLPQISGRILVLTSTDEEPVYLSDDPRTVEMSYSGIPEINSALNKKE